MPLDPELPFVPEVPENMVIPLFPEGTVIPCRVSDPMSEVILKSVPSGVQVSAPYENKIGFIAELSSGQYACETTSAKGVTTASVNYTVVDTKGKHPEDAFFWKHFFFYTRESCLLLFLFLFGLVISCQSHVGLKHSQPSPWRLGESSGAIG